MNKFGEKFKIEICGKSHTEYVGIKIFNFPKDINIDINQLQFMLSKRKAGAWGTTKRIEDDIPIIISGIENNITNGDIIEIRFENNNIKSADYDFDGFYRPGHADFSQKIKYKDDADLRGGGLSSGRMTLPLVSAGYFAKLLIGSINAVSEIVSVGGQENYTTKLRNAIENGDSLGAILKTTITNVNAGLGEPFFNSVESIISQLAFSIPGINGIEFGNGFAATNLYGSENNDIFINDDGKTNTNNAGGINGGISNGNDIVFKVSAKPTASISKMQNTFNFTSKKIEEFKLKGRHDSCFALRLPIVLESISYIAIAQLI